MIKKNPFTTSSQEKNTLQEVGVLLSKSTLKRRFPERKYKGFCATRCKQGQIRLCQKNISKSILWTDEIKINLCQNDGKKKVWRKLGTAHDPKHTTTSVKHGGAVWWHEHAWLPVALGHWCFVMIWQRTEAAGRILKSIGIYTAQFQSNGAKLMTLHSTNGRWPKTYNKSNPRVFEGKKWNVLLWPSQSPNFNPIKQAFHTLKTKLKA